MIAIAIPPRHPALERLHCKLAAEERRQTRAATPHVHAWACGSTPATLQVAGVCPLLIRATRRHSRKMCRTDAFGFPDKAPKATNVVGGFRSGDVVRATVSCNFTTTAGTIQGIHVRYC
jgi:hypothetical protein